MVNKKNNDYAFYSKVLREVFESLDGLKAAEAKYFGELKAKEAKAAAKKADAVKVEEAFKALNQARKDYKDNLNKLTASYQEDLKNLKANFDADRGRVQAALADAETSYSTALKSFTDKHPEGYHLTLKDGDFETTISSQNHICSTNKNEDNHLADLLSLLLF